MRKILASLFVFCGMMGQVLATPIMPDPNDDDIFMVTGSPNTYYDSNGNYISQGVGMGLHAQDGYYIADIWLTCNGDNITMNDFFHFNCDGSVNKALDYFKSWSNVLTFFDVIGDYNSGNFEFTSLGAYVETWYHVPQQPLSADYTIMYQVAAIPEANMLMLFMFALFAMAIQRRRC